MPPDQGQLPVIWVDNSIIREHFNNGHIVDRAISGDLYSIVGKSKHRIPPPPGEPICTKSQMINYYTLNGGNLVASAHQYLRPDGSIGGSGLPDPKRLVLQDRILAVRSTSPRR